MSLVLLGVPCVWHRSLLSRLMSQRTDPTGYDAALEAIPENQLSSRQQRIAIALAMIREGSSVLAAAEATDIPRSSLRRYALALSDVSNTEADGRTTSLEALADQSIVAARIATERVTERLVDDEHEWRDSDLINATKVATANAERLATRPKTAESGVSALAALLEEGDVTVTKRKPDHDAIDVTPEE